MTEREVSSERVSEERLRDIIAGCEGVQSNLMSHIKHLSGLSTTSDRYLQRLDPATVKAMAELALLSLRSSVKTVGVKKLEWEERHDDRGDGFTEHNGGFEASSALGVYEIGMGFGSDSYYWSLTDPIGNEIGDGDDPDKLKAAAQADYERRVLSAIEAPAAPSEVADEMVERGKAARLDVLSGPDEEDPDDRVDRMVRSILTAALKGDRP